MLLGKHFAAFVKDSPVSVMVRGTVERIFELRRFRAAALPGQSLVFYDPRFDLMTDILPCEDAYVEEELSMYYLTLEVAQVTGGMMIAVPAEHWEIFRKMPCAKFAATLVELAHCLDPSKYIKHKRGPKTKQPKKISAKRNHHVSTARILAARK